MNLRSLFFLSMLVCSSSVFANYPHLVMATGGVTGVYYPAGGAICQMMNTQVSKHGIRCFVESSNGSLENIKRLRANEVDLAIVQSDWLIHAKQGTDYFKEHGEFKSLRKVVTLYSEPFTIVARKDSQITSLNDLKGKRVNIGNEGSGQRATMEWLMGVLGWWKSDFSEVFEFGSDDQAEALCNDKFDAMVFVAGSPNSSVKYATTECESVIVPVISSKLDAALERSKFYVKTSVPGGMYRGNPHDVETFGVSANLVSTDHVDAGMVRALVQSMFDDFNVFTDLHPALKRLSREVMVNASDNVPAHEGAKKYFIETGMRGVE